MSDEDLKNNTEQEAKKVAKKKINEEADKRGHKVEESLKEALGSAGFDADIKKEGNKIVAEIPLTSAEEQEKMVKELTEKMMAEAKEKAKKEAEAELKKHQAEIEAEAKKQAEEEAKKVAEVKKKEEVKKVVEEKKVEEKKVEEKKVEPKKPIAKPVAKPAPKKEEPKKEKKPVEFKKSDESKFMPNLKRHYLDNVRAALQKEFNYSSPMQIPRIEKITVSLGCGDAKENKKYLDAAVKELEQITGQHVVRTKARKSIANFKIRQGQEIGAMVTLRNDNMWYFMERLICIALPRVRDFRGVKPTAFDGNGNYSLGITEQIIFPEIDFDKIEKVSGFNIAFITSAKTDKEGFALLKDLGMPFSKR